MDERQTKFSNQIIYNLFKDYKVEDIRILAIMVNRLITKYKAIENEGCIDPDSLVLELGISLEFVKEYKGKKNLSIKEITDIMKKIISFGVQVYEDRVHKSISIVNEVEYDERYKSFKISFNKNAFQYLLLIEDKFTLIDLNIVKELKSKYELGLYILIQMYKDTGLCIRRMEDLKEYFNNSGTSNDLMKYIKAAVVRLNETYHYNIKIEEEKTSKRINTIKIKFKIKHA